jgi:allantoinase
VAAYDLIVRSGNIVGVESPGDDPVRADVAVADGRIVAVSHDLEGAAREEIDATGLHVLPGVIDAHVHFNEPGRTDWEGFATGTRALAAGGTTAYAEMPLNAYPPTLDAQSFDLKLAAAKVSSLIDYAFWGGLVPENVERLEGLAERGVLGFKAFMSDSGIEDFEAADDLVLYEGMQRAAELGLPVLIHAESDQITGRLARRAVAEGRTQVGDYLASRPVVAEVEAIARAIFLAEETGCSLHVVHVSTGRGVALVAAARARGADITCEICTHYLVLTEDDVEELGAAAKCAPPLRARQDLEALWQQIFAGNVEFVASDHSPSPLEMKAGDDFFKVWGGISGCQNMLNVMLDEGHHERGFPIARLATLTSGNVADRFGLRGKGRLQVGSDADLTLVDLDSNFTLRAEDLFYRHKISPFIGMPFRGSIVRTVVRGTTVVRDGRIVSEPVGRFIRPSRRAAATLDVGAGQAGQASQTSERWGVDVRQTGEPN